MFSASNETAHQDVGCRLLELQQLQVVERGQTTLVWTWVRLQEASPATRLLLHTMVMT